MVYLFRFVGWSAGSAGVCGLVRIDVTESIATEGVAHSTQGGIIKVLPAYDLIKPAVIEWQRR